MSKISLDDVEKGRQIGRGTMGTVFLAEHKNKRNKNKYAIKIENIFKEDAKYNLASSTWREVDFLQTLSKKYPDHFEKIYDIRIDDACEHKQSWQGFGIKLSDMPKGNEPGCQNWYKKLWSSGYCSVKLYSHIDTNLNTILESWEKFKPDVFYDLFIQIVYVCYLMDSNGYSHNDFHTRNIGINYTSKKYISVFGHKLPTHGMFVVAFDPLPLHKKYTLKNWEKVKLKNDNDMYGFFNTLLINTAEFDRIYKKELKDRHEWKIKIIIDKDDQKVIDPFIKHLSLTKENYYFLSKQLYKILFTEKWEQQMLGSSAAHGGFPPLKYLIPMSSILFMISNIYDIKKILIYLLKNRTTQPARNT
jgi:hypothetical protein